MRMKTPHLSLKLLAAASSAAVLSGCLVGPNYVRPSAPTSAQFKESPSVQSGWSPAQELDAIPKGAWWSVFQDPVLDGLEKRVVINNQNVAAAEAAYRAARALTAAERSALFPTITATASATRSGGGSRRSGVSTAATTGATTTTTATGSGTTTTTGTTLVSTSGSTTTYSPAIGASWAPDLWGSIRRQIESDVAAAQASDAQLANATLSAQAELATDYMTLRILDEEKRLYDSEVKAYQRSLTITQNQYRAGTMAQTNVITAQSNLLSVQAQDQDIGILRAQNEHAIAILVGVAPAELTIDPIPLNRAVPIAPADVPSTLLQRRPDIASAERTMKQNNAQIGVQVAAYFPDITLSGSYGYSASKLGSLFASGNSVWAYAGQLSETILDFGARRARVRQAKAVYDQSVAQYRQTVLTALQGVEDQLVALRIYQSEAVLRDQAAAVARKAEELTLNQYKAGTVDYTSVVTTEATALTDAVSALQILNQRQVASIALIENLGGGWTAADLPKS